MRPSIILFPYLTEHAINPCIHYSNITYTILMCAHEQEAEKESLLHLLVDYQNEVSGRVCSLHHINVIIYACYTFILVWCLRGRVMKKKWEKTTFLTGTLYSPLSLFRLSDPYALLKMWIKKQVKEKEKVGSLYHNYHYNFPVIIIMATKQIFLSLHTESLSSNKMRTTWLDCLQQKRIYSGV